MRPMGYRGHGGEGWGRGGPGRGLDPHLVAEEVEEGVRERPLEVAPRGGHGGPGPAGDGGIRGTGEVLGTLRRQAGSWVPPGGFLVPSASRLRPTAAGRRGVDPPTMPSTTTPAGGPRGVVLEGLIAGEEGEHPEVQERRRTVAVAVAVAVRRPGDGGAAAAGVRGEPERGGSVGFFQRCNPGT